MDTIPPLPTDTDSVASVKPQIKPLYLISLSVFIILVLVGILYFLTKSLNNTAPKQTSVIPQSAPQPTIPVHGLIGNPSAPIQLTYAIHWTEQFQTDGIFENNKLLQKGLQQYLQEYVSLHPEIAFQILVINYADYAAKLPLLNEAGSPPDIYQIYAPWGVSYVKNGILDTPPQDITQDIATNYISTKGATIDGKIWGFPTEVNTYALLYNKNIFKSVGLTQPPKTFSELVEAAVKTTQYDQSGNISRYGIAFLKGNDWQVVDPFLAWLFSNSGQYLSSDMSQALFNSPAALQVLEGELQLFKRRATDNNANFFDFKDGKVAMVISPPWPKAIFKTSFGDKFESTVGVSPLPYFKKPATLQYSWFMGVMAKSKHTKEAWNFLKWFNTEVQPTTNTTRYGDLLANNIGAIPSRKIDMANHKESLNDFFTRVFIDQIKYSIPEPNVQHADQIKKLLMSQIEASWTYQKSASEALTTAATAVNALIAK